MIDHERLANMTTAFGAKEVALIIDAFVEEASGALAALRAGWNDDAVRLERLHFLKGCARTIGAIRLGDLCERFEGATSGPGDVRALEREFAVVRAELAAGRLGETG